MKSASFRSVVLACLLFPLMMAFEIAPAQAIELDWSGQFRSEADYVKDYNFHNGAATDSSRVNQGYYIPGGGSTTAQFQSLFMKLKPKAIVNDNIYIKSEFWIGDPIYGLFGGGQPQGFDQRQFYSNQSRGSTVTAQRFWGEYLSDLGTLQVGRLPLNWGLGAVWSSGDGLWDRYESTGDSVRLVSKFGSFSVVPAFTKYSMGNTIAGTCSYSSATGSCTTTLGGGGVSEYGVSFKYENPDEDLEGGVNFVRRITGGNPDPTSGMFSLQQGPTGSTGLQALEANYTTWDLYARKKIGRVTLAGEVPIVSGDLSGVSYKTFAVALESKVKITEPWDASVKMGHVPGQPSQNGAAVSRFKTFYFNPNYKLGMIMFNYALQNFAGPQTQNAPGLTANQLSSPYNNPITNANYLALATGVKVDKWHFDGGFVWAKANETATPGNGNYVFNSWRNQFESSPASSTVQNSSLGWEMDYNTTFQWDDAFQFGAGAGWFFPGAFYKYSGTAVENNRTPVFAAMLRAGVVF